MPSVYSLLCKIRSAQSRTLLATF